MKNTILKVLVITLFLIPFYVSNCFGSGFDFKKTNWGMSQKQVIESENASVLWKDKDTVLYKTTVLGKAIGLSYRFSNDKLISTVYLLEDAHSDANLYIDDFYDFSKALNVKYGVTKDYTFWKNTLFKNNLDSYGVAVSIGHLTFVQEWITKSTEIGLILHGDNFKSKLGVSYTSVKYKNLQIEEDTKKYLHQL